MEIEALRELSETYSKMTFEELWDLLPSSISTPELGWCELVVTKVEGDITVWSYANCHKDSIIEKESIPEMLVWLVQNGHIERLEREQKEEDNKRLIQLSSPVVKMEVVLGEHLEKSIEKSIEFCRNYNGVMELSFRDDIYKITKGDTLETVKQQQ